jgi:glutamate-1-semialdehyde 2,1-aminomutase
MLTLFIGVPQVGDHASAVRADTDRFGRFFRGMLEKGFYLPPSQFEAMFLSLAHTEADVARFTAAARSVLTSG